MKKFSWKWCAAALLLTVGTVALSHRLSVAQDAAPRAGANLGEALSRNPAIDPAAGVNYYFGVVSDESPETQLRTEEAAQAQVVQQLLAKYGTAADEADRAKLRVDITAAVAAQFDKRQELRELELKSLLEKLKRLREIQQRRANEKQLIVEARVDGLIRELEGVGWGGEGGSHVDPTRNDSDPFQSELAPVTR